MGAEHFLNTQHCLAIAATFIAIIAACATLINSANNKAESLAERIYKATEEYRLPKSGMRCAQILRELDIYKARFLRVQQAQRLLFVTIGIFIASLAIFIGLGLYIIFFNMTAEVVSRIVRAPIFMIGLCVSVGTVFMLTAICLQFWEIGKSYYTLCIETEDCKSHDSLAASMPQQPDMAA